MLYNRYFYHKNYGFLFIIQLILAEEIYNIKSY